MGVMTKLMIVFLAWAVVTTILNPLFQNRHWKWVSIFSAIAASACFILS